MKPVVKLVYTLLMVSLGMIMVTSIVAYFFSYGMKWVF
jgi:hypothetical protein